MKFVCQLDYPHWRYITRTGFEGAELIKGKTIWEALEITNKVVVEALEGLPPVKVHCSVLAEEAIKAAVADYYKKNGIDKEVPMPVDCHECELH